MSKALAEPPTPESILLGPRVATVTNHSWGQALRPRVAATACRTGSKDVDPVQGGDIESTNFGAAQCGRPSLILSPTRAGARDGATLTSRFLVCRS